MKNFLRLPAGDKFLCFQSLVVLAVVQLGLKLVGFGQFKKWTKLAFAGAGKADGPGQFERVARAVEWAGLRAPFKATCLHKSLTVKYFCRASQQVRLHVGVQKLPGGKLAAHAWVEHEGKTVGGGLLGQHYQTLWIWE